MIAKAVGAARKLGWFYLVFGAGFVVGCVYVAALLVIPPLLEAVTRSIMP